MNIFKVLLLLLLYPIVSLASSGRTDKDGCHTSQAEGYHCHRDQAVGKGDLVINEQLFLAGSIGVQKSNFSGNILISTYGIMVDASYKLYLFSPVYISPNLTFITEQIEFDRFVVEADIHPGANIGIDLPISSKNFFNMSYNFRFHSKDYAVHFISIGYVFGLD